MKKTMIAVVMTGAVLGAAVAPVLAAEFRLPAFETVKLPNGLTVYLMERHEVPLISVRAVVKAGAVNDAAQPGLSNLTGDALLLGTRARNKKAIDEAFDFRGARLAGGAGAESSTVQANFARKDAAALLPLFAEIVQQPSFDDAELAKLRERKVIGLKQAKEAPRNVVGTYYRAMLFGNAPYGIPASGTVGSVSALKQADVQRYYGQFYRPDNAAIVVVGDFQKDEMRRQIESLFGAWKATGPAPQQQDNGKVQADKARVWLVNKPDAIETTFLIGGAGIARNDADYVPLQVLNTILGGRFTSWLNDELRVNSGLTYGASSQFSVLSQTGTFAISSFTASVKTGDALALAHKTYQRLWDKGIDKATLDSAKAYVKGQFPPRYETGEQLAGLLGDMYASDVGREQIDNFTRDVDSLTPERAKALVNKHFPRNNLQTVLIGKAADIRDVAKKYGDVTELEIGTDGFQPVAK
ncbi:M16 family metallopeptidase [Duganella phyllosphaerae]|uniref:Peptidase M16 inactive domain protein n=1 Tax=Duganella phyllosphaerae TaxID=762836 RepID=A0A1E7W8J6_9BURK|nr:pitrilysin family protein [Duganella phyllosphaerae]OEZ92577.1 peptidase M16 inactive domain protein [Duganella phyllosphaerae]